MAPFLLRKGGLIHSRRYITTKGVRKALTNEFNTNAKKYEKAHRRRKLWHRIISVLSAFTVFVTTYALILPAITMEPSAGIKMDNVLVYENDDVAISFYVTGRAGFENEEEAVDDAEADKVKAEVKLLDAKSAVYSEYARYVSQNIDSGKMYRLMAVNVQFTYEGARLNVENCDIKLEISAKQALVDEGLKGLNLNPVKVSESALAAGKNTDGNEVLALTVLQGVTGALDERETAYAAKEGDSVRLEAPMANNTMAIALYSTTNPVYTVQYYSHVTRFDSAGDANIAVLDNSNATLAQNGVTYTVGDGLVDAHLDLIEGTSQYRMATHLELAPMYKAKEYEYVKAPGLAYIDRNRASGNFELYQVWVLKAGKSADSANQSDWNVYGADVSFTNRAESASGTRIHITDDTVIRLIYNEVGGQYVQDVQFYDYDVTDGDIHNASGTAYSTTAQNDTDVWYAATYDEGINKYTAASGTVKLSFGNTNTGTAYGSNSWNGQLLNRYNTGSYKGCTFGIVTGMNADKTLKYAEGISAPVLFTEVQQVGKTVINGYSLQFSRNGDTYVLSSVKTDKGAIAVKDLDKFNNPTCGETTYTSIFTNNFWPMDASSTWGGIGHDLKFGSYDLRNNRKFFQTDSTFSTTQGNMPYSDDGLDHNSYFGMHYEVDFTLSEDYVGALEYIFYGDDDMWVFLDGVLICDIGGVHSSVGQFVDLWPYIDKMAAGDRYGTHTLSFYYTERGASGSTCYMAFTLPSVSSEMPQLETASLELGKQVINGNTNADFSFTVALRDANGNTLTDDYSYTLYDARGKELGTYIINNTENQIKLSHGEKMVINYLPKGSRYTITEEAAAGYHTVYTLNGGISNEGNTASGTLSGDTRVLFINSSGLMLPQTGGRGIIPYLIPLALGVIMLPLIPITDALLKRRRQKFK